MADRENMTESISGCHLKLSYWYLAEIDTHIQIHMKSLPTSNVLHNYRSKCGHFSWPAECSLSKLFINEGSCQNRQDEGELVTKNITIKTETMRVTGNHPLCLILSPFLTLVYDDVEKTLISATSVDVFLLFK